MSQEHVVRSLNPWSAFMISGLVGSSAVLALADWKASTAAAVWVFAATMIGIKIGADS
jgi:hypothetical protein